MTKPVPHRGQRFGEQGMYTHPCPGKCGRLVDRAMFACRTDWFRLPVEIRNAINSRNPGRKLRGSADAFQWFRDNLRAST